MSSDHSAYGHEHQRVLCRPFYNITTVRMSYGSGTGVRCCI